MASKDYYVYIMSSKSKVLYIGVTNNLVRRTYEHREGLVDGFTKKYNCKQLVYYEQGGSIEDAIVREKQIKKWRREKKVTLIEKINSDWIDLGEDILSLS